MGRFILRALLFFASAVTGVLAFQELALDIPVISSRLAHRFLHSFGIGLIILSVIPSDLGLAKDIAANHEHKWGLVARLAIAGSGVLLLILWAILPIKLQGLAIVVITGVALAFVGHLLTRDGVTIKARDRRSPNKTLHLSYFEQRAFSDYLFSLFACLCKADGKISPIEIACLERFMKDDLKYEKKARERAISVFRRAVANRADAKSIANKINLHFRHRPAILRLCLELLCELANSDRDISATEWHIVKVVARTFEVSDRRIYALGQQYGYSDTSYEESKFDRASTGRGTAEASSEPLTELERAYAVLGCNAKSSEEDIKRRYRRLALKYHPDRIQSKGLPPEQLALATRRFQKIQRAYDYIVARMEKN